jgi:hypothetical protein
MEDYWGAKENGNEPAAAAATEAQDDVDMIE